MATAENEEINEGMIGILAAGSALMNFVALATLGLIVFEDLSFGLVSGVFMGIGAYFFVPWILLLQADTDELSGLAFRANDPQKGAVGVGLEIGAISMIVAQFTFEDTALSIGAGIAAALAVFLVASIAFRRIQ